MTIRSIKYAWAGTLALLLAMTATVEAQSGGRGRGGGGGGGGGGGFGIESLGDYFAQDFETGGSTYKTISDQSSEPASLFNHWDISPTDANNFERVSGGANGTSYSARVKFPQGADTHRGYHLSYYRKNKTGDGARSAWNDSIYHTTGTEWGAAYLRYYIKFDTSFSTLSATGDTVSGKIPGLAGTRYVGAGGDGVTNHPGSNGWSARIAWKRTAYDDSVTLTGYVYTVDYGGEGGGKNIPDPGNKAPRIKVGVWNKIEVFVGLNSYPYSSTEDGAFRLYINGTKRVEVTTACCTGNLKMYHPDGSLNGPAQDLQYGLQFTTHDSTRMNRAWFDFYYGGDKEAPKDLYMWLDEIVMSPTYVGKPVASSSDALPAELSLEQNAPNPFNPETTIRFSLPEANPVQLKIYNLAGQTVRTLVDGFMIGGHYQEVWDGKDQSGKKVASGVYIYQLQAGAMVEKRKMVLLE